MEYALRLEHVNTTAHGVEDVHVVVSYATVVTSSKPEHLHQPSLTKSRC